MTLSIYLNFDGNCREAFEFYRSVFGGEFIHISTFGEGPADMEIPEEERDGIMHVSLPIGASVLMGSDMPSGFGPTFRMGNNFSVSYASHSRAETDELFAGISQGGAVTMAPADMFWGSYFGSCIDKFGVAWQFNCDLRQEQTMQAKITFRIISWDEEPFDEPESGPKLTQAHIKRSFEGDLIGAGNLMYVMTSLDDRNASFAGFEKVVGSLAGRTGSFVLRHTGFYDGEKATAKCEVVPGSGTDQLAELSATGEFSAGHAEEHEMTLEYQV